jgi:tetratricopeptide (TPR) repeat protein
MSSYYGPMLYDWGYSTYSNPYYVPSSTVVVEQPVVYDYSQPINPTAPQPAQSVTDQAVSQFDQARDAFKNGDYTSALSLVDQALVQLPNDPALHEFRALVLFALQRYDEASVALYAVLSIGPGWDWPTLVGLYPDVETYTAQLRALESYIAQHSQSAPARFVLAYHYLTEGHADAAAAQLERVTQLQPNDKLSAQILASLRQASQPAVAGATGASPTALTPTTLATAPPLTAPAATAPPVTTSAAPSGREGQLTGEWTAHPAQAQDSTITMTFTEGNHFVWKVTQQGKTQQFQGDRTFGNGILTLAQSGEQAQAQPPLVGRVTWQDENHFNFKLIPGEPGDPGLSFAKSS